MDEEKEKKEYEIALLLKSEEDMGAVTALIRQHDGELVAEPRAKKLALAYKIKGHSEAIFVHCNFMAAGENAKALEQDLNTRAEVIRFMILASPPPPNEPQSAPMSSTGTPLPPKRRGRPVTHPSSSPSSEARPPAPPRPLSNEALEKKIEEILQ